MLSEESQISWLYLVAVLHWEVYAAKGLPRLLFNCSPHSSESQVLVNVFGPACTVILHLGLNRQLGKTQFSLLAIINVVNVVYIISVFQCIAVQCCEALQQ